MPRDQILESQRPAGTIYDNWNDAFNPSEISWDFGTSQMIWTPPPIAGPQIARIERGPAYFDNGSYPARGRRVLRTRRGIQWGPGAVWDPANFMTGN